MTDGRIAAEKFRSTEMKYKRYKISGKDIYILQEMKPKFVISDIRSLKEKKSKRR